MEKKYSVPAVEKMLEIVELLAESGRGYSINELARLTHNSLNSVYRICTLLHERGYLIIDKESGYYVLGSGFYFIGKAAEKRMMLNNVARPVLARLMHETGESVQLITMRGDRADIRMQAETQNPIRIHVETCSVIYPHCSAGAKCILAHMSEKDLSQTLPASLEQLTANTISDIFALYAELSEIRESGVSFDREEYMTGLRCIGAPIFDADGVCTAGIDVMYPIYRVDTQHEASFIPLVKKAAEDISFALGFNKRNAC